MLKQKSEKQAEADAAQAEANAIQAKIDALPGWRIGAFGTIGGSISNFDNWYAQGSPNNSSGNIGFTVNAYANLIHEKFLLLQLNQGIFFQYKPEYYCQFFQSNQNGLGVDERLKFPALSFSISILQVPSFSSLLFPV